MNMNKRSTPRKDLQLDVDVFSCGTYLGRSTTRDIHADGAFIEGAADEFYQNDVLDLRFIPELDEIKPVRLRAMVVRGAVDGVGVLFGYGETEFMRLLKKLSRKSRDDYAEDVMQSMFNHQ
jgi:hypothetical protein